MSHRAELQSFVEHGLRALGDAVAHKLGDKNSNPCDNSGARFENEVFTMNSYCWCCGDTPEHAEGCPPNFYIESLDFDVEWYKYLGRGSNQNKEITYEQWSEIFLKCLNSLK